MTLVELKNTFKKMYCEEFNDPNESFMDFMLDLISKKDLERVLKKGKKYFYLRFDKYK